MNPKCQKRTFKRGESSRDTWTGRVKDTVEATVPDRVRGNYSTSARSCQTRRCARVEGRVGSRSRRDSKATAPCREFPTRAPPQKASSGEVCKISNDKTHMKTRERDRIAQRTKTQRNDFDASWKRKIGMMLMKRKKCQEILLKQPENYIVHTKTAAVVTSLKRPRKVKNSRKMWKYI